MIGLKLTAVQILSNVAIIIINTILLISFYNFVLLHNIQNFLNLNIPPSSIFFLMFTSFVFINNNSIPFSSYILDEDESIEEAFKEELFDITLHIFVSSFVTALTVISMYGFMFL